jgi:Repeat of unknown function (DUF5907)
LASWTLADGTNYITIATAWRTFQISKFARIEMSVAEPILRFHYSDNNPELVTLRSDNNFKNWVNTRTFDIDFNDVVSPVVGSAAALETIILAWLAIVGGTAVADGNYTDVTVSGVGTVWTINNDVVTYAKMQNVSASPRLLGRATVGAGNTEEITLGTNLSITGTTLNAASGGGGYSIVAVNFAASPYTILPTSGTTIYQVDCTGGNVVINVPTAVGNTAVYGVKKTDASANTITVTPNGAETIDGNATQTILFQNTEIDIYSDNANLFIK